MTPPPLTPEESESLRSVHTANLPAIFDQIGMSLVISTYQAGKVILVRNDGGALNTHFRTFAKPMGIVADDIRLTIGGVNTVWDYRNMPAVAPKLDPPGKHDACYIPRRIHVTGDIDIHELGRDRDNELWVVNTRFCCLCTLDPDHSFHPRWRPPFVSALAAEDRCHLNGLAMVDGKPKYVTALGETDTPGGWRANKARGGLLMDIETNEILLRGLSMPHSPRWYRDKLWLLESGEGTLAEVDLQARTWRTVAQVPGFTRGIDFIGPLAFIGLSQVRESAVFSGIPLVQRVKERNCGVWVVNIETGETVGFLRFESGVQEIFAVQALRGIRFPEMLEWDDPRLSQSYVLPDEALADIYVPSEAELARSPGFHFQRGNQLYNGGKPGEAIVAYRQVVALQREFPNARFALALALSEAGQYAEAETWLKEVVEAEPEKAEAHNSLGFALSNQGEAQKAIACYERAIELQPNYAQAHFNLGMSLLHLGDYARGFAECEWRWKLGQSPLSASHAKWDGAAAPEKTVAILAEDAANAIQFARYIPLAAERCKKLIVACRAPLMPLFATLPGVAGIREIDAIGAAEFDVYLPLASLPYVFGTTLETIPAGVPYLDGAALCRRNEKAALLLPPTSALKVGLAWGDGGAAPADERRSCPLRAFLPLLAVPGIEFFGLQRVENAESLNEISSKYRFRDLAPQIENLGDLAVAVEQMDLIIAVDSPAAHLAGALGKPVWTLLGEGADWRWRLTEPTTPWYPTMRLYRRRRSGDWSGVIEQIVPALKEFEGRRGRPKDENAIKGRYA